MKLAEALQERADLNSKINELRSRLSNNATVQEGEAPAENPAELLSQLDECAARLEELMARINATNCATVTERGTPYRAYRKAGLPDPSAFGVPQPCERSKLPCAACFPHGNKNSKRR